MWEFWSILMLGGGFVGFIMWIPMDADCKARRKEADEINEMLKNNL